MFKARGRVWGYRKPSRELDGVHLGVSGYAVPLNSFFESTQSAVSASLIPLAIRRVVNVNETQDALRDLT